MENEIKQKVEAIHEGIQYLKGKTNFEGLLYKDRLREVEMGIDRYRSNQQPLDAINHALQIFHETAGLTLEGAAAYDQTIWDANVQSRGKMTTLDHLFFELETLMTRK